jgi:protein-S-isoprenylcysteine O-methyltransferase Ste14
MDAKDKKKGNLLVAIQFVLLAAILLFPNTTEGSLLPSWVFSFGGYLIWPGLAILAVSIFKLGPSLTASPVPKEDSTLVVTGLYKFMRHPIYTGLLITGLGLSLEAGVLPHIWFWAGLVWLLVYKSNWEEVLLAERYPEYAAYKARTGRFFPKLGK